ncbi:MAG: NADH-quinone oxidoreductase subunit H [Thermoanaerobaculia bacterium]|nr:NADH-quinone oxidoreductase subunit H [Thermoanaerobaculia bacterium]
MSFDTPDIILSLIKIGIVLGLVLSVTPVWVWVERRGSALIQDRPGPNRIGPLGLMQAMADAAKFILKEDLVPAQAHKVLYTLAPMFGLIPAVTTCAVIPFARGFVIPEVIEYSGLIGAILVGGAVAHLVLGIIALRVTSHFGAIAGATRVNQWIGRLVAVGLFATVPLLLGIFFWFRSAGPVEIPFGFAGRHFEPIIADVSVGILLFFALSSLGVYGMATAGWASANKYSMIGAIRASAQMISYELALTLAAVGVLLGAGTLRLTDIVYRQSGTFVLFDTIPLPAWNIFPMFIGFIIFWVAAFAETNRLPFDFAEAEAEIVAGFHTEYSSMKFALFFMAEYMAMGTISALIATLFLGGWDIPYWNEPANFVGFLASFASFILKTSFFLFVFVWVRWTVPRLKYDLLMKLGWKVFLPLALLNIVIVAILIPLGWI